VDPFYVRLMFSPVDYLKMMLVFITLVPIRIVGALMALTLAWAVSCVGLINIDQTLPVSGWRRILQKLSYFLGRVCIRCCGFSVTVSGIRVDASVAPVLILAPHSTFFDSLAIAWLESFIVTKESTKDILLFGKTIQFAQAIFVSRECRDSKECCKKEIIRRANSEEEWPQLMIFPEGTTSNRQALMSFKSGGFLHGKPVQPVLIKYHLKHDTVSWTWDQPHGFIACFMYTICQVITGVEFELLPPYIPSTLEKNDPLLFANNVRQEMADALGVPIYDITYEEVKNVFRKKQERKKEN